MLSVRRLAHSLAPVSHATATSSHAQKLGESFKTKPVIFFGLMIPRLAAVFADSVELLNVGTSLDRCVICSSCGAVVSA